MTRKIIALAVAFSALTAPAFGDNEGFDTSSCATDQNAVLPGSNGQAGVHRVKPGDEDAFQTIQEAVDASAPGDTVLIYPAVYNEAVKVGTDALRIRGTSRSGVILDGGATNDRNGLEIGIDGTKADRLLVENLTVHNYTRHGIFFNEVKGYWARYVSAYDNGLYGIYAFDSRCGQIDHSFTSGNADSGFYIGECFPCDAVIHDIIAYQNALGYSGTNAGGNLVIRDSLWKDNAMGIVPNTLDSEARPPQRGVVIKNNTLIDNSNKTVPGDGIAGTYYGAGIVLAGGQGNIVYGNTVVDSSNSGIHISPLPDSNMWIASGNTVWGNTVSHDATKYPDAVDISQAATSGPNNCWSDNVIGNSAPEGLQEIWACGQTATPPGGDPRGELLLILGAAGLNGRTPGDEYTWPYTYSATDEPSQPDEDDDSSYVNDEAPDEWVPALGY